MSAESAYLEAKKLCHEVYGTDDEQECSDRLTRAADAEEWSLQVTDKTCDTSIFPYQAQGPLETPIPTVEQIKQARQDMPRSRTEWRVGPYMVKACISAAVFQEAENLLYLEKNSTVRYPRLYAAFQSEGQWQWDWSPEVEQRTIYYIVMEYVEGQSLKELEDEFLTRPFDRSMISEKIGNLLGEQLRKLRSVPPEDPNHFGRINGRAYTRMLSRYGGTEPDLTHNGPFNYEELVKHFIMAGRVRCAVDHYCWGNYDPEEDILQQRATSVLIDMADAKDRVPVLSRTSPGYFLVKLIRDETGRPIDVEEVVLTNWACMAWVPSWYEHSQGCFHSMDHAIKLRHRRLEPSWGNPHLFTSVYRHARISMGEVNLKLSDFYSRAVLYGALPRYI